MEEFIDMFGGTADAALLAPAVAAVHQVSPLDGSRFDPQTLLHAADTLHGLGEERAARALDVYIRQAEGRPRAVEGMELDPSRAVLVMRVLYVARRSSDPLPAPLLGKPDVELSADPAVAPQGPLVLSCEIPFLPVGVHHVGGAAPSAVEMLATYRRLGRLRDGPPVPSCAPVEAADRLVGSDNWRRLVPPAREPYARSLVYEQALRASGMDGDTIARLASADPAQRERLWQQAARDPVARGLVWDSAAGRFARR